jgi:hypothetical protein
VRGTVPCSGLGLNRGIHLEGRETKGKKKSTAKREKIKPQPGIASKQVKLQRPCRATVCSHSREGRRLRFMSTRRIFDLRGSENPAKTLELGISFKSLLKPSRIVPNKVPTYRDVPIVHFRSVSDAACSDYGAIDAAFERCRTELAWPRRTGAATSTTGTASQKTFRAGITIARSRTRSFSRTRANGPGRATTCELLK